MNPRGQRAGEEGGEKGALGGRLSQIQPKSWSRMCREVRVLHGGRVAAAGLTVPQGSWPELLSSRARAGAAAARPECCSLHPALTAHVDVVHGTLEAINSSHGLSSAKGSLVYNKSN